MKIENNILKNISRVVLSTLFCITSVGAQTSKSDPNDTQGWLGAKLKLDLPKGWITSAEYQTRFINDITAYNGSYITLGAEKKFNKLFTAETAFRVALVEKGTYLRYSLGGELNKKASDFEFKLRLLIQNQTQDFIEPNRANQNDLSWRARFQTDFDLNDDFNLYVSTEPVMKFGGVHFVDNWRNTIGLKYSVAKRTKVDFYYMYRPDYAKAKYNRVFQIIGFDINHTLKF